MGDPRPGELAKWRERAKKPKRPGDPCKGGCGKVVNWDVPTHPRCRECALEHVQGEARRLKVESATRAAQEEQGARDAAARARAIAEGRPTPQVEASTPLRRFHLTLACRQCPWRFTQPEWTVEATSEWDARRSGEWMIVHARKQHVEGHRDREPFRKPAEVLILVDPLGDG